MDMNATASQNWIDRVGRFRGRVIGAKPITSTKADSQSVGISITAQIDECFNGEGWDDWRQYEMVAGGALWIIGKDGQTNDRAIETARDVIGWNGDLEDLAVEDWNPIQFTTKQDTYKDKSDRFIIEWINPYDDAGPSSLSPDDIKRLKSQHGTKLRAAFGARPAVAPPTGKPSSPPPANRKPATQKGQSDRDKAWIVLNEIMEGESEQAIAKTFSDAIGAYEATSQKAEADFTPQDWFNIEKSCRIPI